MTIDAVANLPVQPVRSGINEGIKAATPELVAFLNPVLPEDYMVDLVFENIGGQELINISRNDLLSGQSFVYQPIKNITSIFFQYNPQNILKLQDTSSTYFKNFPIKFEDKVPDIGNGPNGEIVYLDSDPESATFGDILIDVVNLGPEEQIEVEIMYKGSVLNDTEYGAV